MQVATQELPTNTVITLKQITDKLGLRHDKSLLKVEKLAEEASFGAVSYLDIVYNDQGQTITTMAFTKKQAIAAGARLDNSQLMIVIDMVENPSKPKQMTHLETAKMLVQTLETNELLEHRVNEQRKVITAVADLNMKVGEVTLSQFAKNINIKELGRNNLFVWLKEKKVLQPNNDPYQTIVERGYMVLRPSREKIHGKYRYTTMLTAKGTIWLAKALRKAGFEIKEETLV